VNTLCVCVCVLPQAIFLFFLIKYKPLKYNNVYTYPDWGYAIGWCMAMSSMVCIPLGMVWMIWKTPGTFSEVNTRPQQSYGGGIVTCLCQRNVSILQQSFGLNPDGKARTDR